MLDRLVKTLRQDAQDLSTASLDKNINKAIFSYIAAFDFISILLNLNENEIEDLFKQNQLSHHKTLASLLIKLQNEVTEEAINEYLNKCTLHNTSALNKLLPDFNLNDIQEILTILNERRNEENVFDSVIEASKEKFKNYVIEQINGTNIQARGNTIEEILQQFEDDINLALVSSASDQDEQQNLRLLDNLKEKQQQFSHAFNAENLKKILICNKFNTDEIADTVNVLRSEEFTDALDREMHYGIVERLERASKHYENVVLDENERKNPSDRNVEIRIHNETIIKCVKILTNPTAHPEYSENDKKALLEGYLLKLSELISKLNSKKIALKTDQKKQIETINYYIQLHKSEYNKTLAVLRLRDDKAVIDQVCSQSDKAFDKYLLKIFRAKYKNIAINHAQYNLIDINYQDIKNAANLFTIIEGQLDLIRRDLLADENKHLNEYEKIEYNLQKSKLARLDALYRELANEYFTYHTPGRSHEGKYGLTNPALYFGKNTLEDLKQANVDEKDMELAIAFANRKAHVKELALKLLEHDAAKAKNKHQEIFKTHQANSGKKESLPNKLDLTLAERLADPGSINAAWDGSDGSLDYAKNFLIEFDEILSRPNNQPIFTNSLHHFTTKLSAFPKGVRRDYIENKIFERFRNVIEMNAPAVKFLDANDAEDNSISYYKHYTHFADQNIADTAKEEMKSIKMSLLSSVANLFETKDAIKSATNSADIEETLNKLKNCHSMDDYLSVMEKLAERSTLLSKSWHISNYYYRAIILEAMQSILNTHFLQNAGPKLPTTIEHLRKAQFLFRLCEDNSRGLKNKETEHTEFMLEQKIKRISVLDPDVNQIRLIPHKSNEEHSLPDASTIAENRVKRFRERLLKKLTASTIADYALFSNKIAPNGNTQRVKLLQQGGSLVGNLAAVNGIPLNGGINAGVNAIARLEAGQIKDEAHNAVNSRPEILFWFKCIDQFSVLLSQVYASQIKNMAGINDPERFAEFCQLRIDEGLAKMKKNDLEPNLDNMNKYMEILYSCLRNGTKQLGLWGTDKYFQDGDSSIFFANSSFQELLKYTSLQYTDEKEQPKILPYNIGKKAASTSSYGVADLRFFSNSKSIVDKICNNKMLENRKVLK